MTNKDMQQIENVNNAKKVIFDRFQIPSPMRENEAQTYDNYASAQYVFYDRTILPFVNGIFEELTQFFRKRKVLKDNQYISYNPSEITALQKRFAEELKFKKEIGVLTINELRELQGYDGIGEEGDVLYQPIGNVPVGFMNNFNSLENGEKKIRTILEKKGIAKDKIEALVGKFYANSK
jgi:phage portal protein BeeE